MRKIIVIAFAMVLFACKSKQINQNTRATYSSVEITASGGVTGGTSGFLIQENAEIYLTGQLPGKAFQQKFHRSSSVDSVKRIFDFLSKKDFDKAQHNVPGNITYGIILQRDSIRHAIYWADGQDSVAQYTEMYKYLRGFASGRTKTILK
jgi:hypothetical protein